MIDSQDRESLLVVHVLSKTSPSENRMFCFGPEFFPILSNLLMRSPVLKGQFFIVLL